ncbi:MAG: diguanylate cyclase [Campylobacterota bacterium]|nr:diguanylate cyclase [Campylobacterota bacterium]
MKTDNIIRKYILTLSVIFGLILATRVYFDIKHHKDLLDAKKYDFSRSISKTFINAEINLIDKYTMIIGHFLYSDKIFQYFKKDKREELYSFLNKDFALYKSQDKNLQVMHFIDKNNVTVLRMHKPNSFDDDLSKKRPMVAYANSSLKEQTGFEVGKNGIVYRVATPYIHMDTKEHVGVLEFGIKPEYFVDILSEQFNVEAEILVKTKALSVLLAQKKYPMIGEYSIISKNPLFDNISKSIDISKTQQLINYNNKTYMVYTNLNLRDFQGENISKIIILKDITDFIENNNKSLVIINSFTLMIFLLILTILYIVLNKFSSEIQENVKTITKLNQRSSILKSKADTDELTKAFNKRYFDKYLKKFLRKHKNGSLIFFDIDHFKKINDTHGHLAGDEILKKLSLIVKSFLREEDLFVRWGGEEFVVLIENMGINSAQKKAEEIRKLIENTLFYNDIPVTISLGVTQIIDDDTKDILIKRADNLLYKAKSSGRNCVVC